MKELNRHHSHAAESGQASQSCGRRAPDSSERHLRSKHALEVQTWHSREKSISCFLLWHNHESRTCSPRPSLWPSRSSTSLPSGTVHHHPQDQRKVRQKVRQKVTRTADTESISFSLWEQRTKTRLSLR